MRQILFALKKMVIRSFYMVRIFFPRNVFKVFSVENHAKFFEDIFKNFDKVFVFRS